MTSLDQISLTVNSSHMRVVKYLPRYKTIQPGFNDSYIMNLDAWSCSVIEVGGRKTVGEYMDSPDI